ncbi:MAG TPA: energy transducer TonB [Candidatus Dormibacteraeota bacterium]|jgi:protein TonB|nr:energy transducer TonB [Candidatus Dormibacteraeota bacterium]
MSVEENKDFAGQIGTLGSCLIEGNSEQKSRERRTKRRSLAISIAIQSAVIVAFVLVPLLGRTEKLPFTLFTPIPQYYHSASERVQPARAVAPIHQRECVVCFDRNLSPHPSTQSATRRVDGPIGDVDLGPDGDSSNQPTGLNIFDSRNQPTPPEDPNRNQKKRISVGGAVQQAMLIHRVDPSYPPLARQLRLSGQVHLHAVIAMDGSVESLQVMDGHPLLVKSALDAVGQWRYQPTKLNGQPVEVETIITVVYTLNQ